MQWLRWWYTGYVDWHAVHLQSTAELVSQVDGVYPDWCRVQAVSTADLTGSHAAVTSTSLSASVTTSKPRRGVERVRRTCTDQSTVSRSETSLTQSAERRRRLYCSLCRVKLNADQQAEQHYSGKLHARKSKMLTLLNTTSKTNASQSLVVDTQVRSYERLYDHHQHSTVISYSNIVSVSLVRAWAELLRIMTIVRYWSCTFSKLSSLGR